MSCCYSDVIISYISLEYEMISSSNAIQDSAIQNLSPSQPHFCNFWHALYLFIFNLAAMHVCIFHKIEKPLIAKTLFLYLLSLTSSKYRDLYIIGVQHMFAELIFLSPLRLHISIAVFRSSWLFALFSHPGG